MKLWANTPTSEREHQHREDAEARQRRGRTGAGRSAIGEQRVDAAHQQVDEIERAADRREQHHAGDQLVLEQACRSGVMGCWSLRCED